MVGNILWYPEEFLVKYIPSLRKQLDLKLLAQNRATQVNVRSQNLSKEAHLISSQVGLSLELTHICLCLSLDYHPPQS